MLNLIVKAERERAAKIARILVEDFKSRRKIFKKYPLNKTLFFPKTDERSLALFTIYTISIDYGMRAEILFKKLKNLFERNNKFFNPTFLLSKFDRKSLGRFFEKELGLRFPNRAAERWLNLSKILIERYEGDVRKIFESRDALRIFEELKNIKGFGPKLSSLFIKFAVSLNFTRNLKNLEKVPIPVDVHLAKLAFRLGIIKGKEKDYQKFIPEIIEIWSKAARNAKVSWLDLNDALWILGAYGCKKKLCEICSVKKFCLISKS